MTETQIMIFFIIMVVLFGIVIGSFLNVCIFRIPLKEDIAVERSHCMHCGHVLSWYELIPLFSFIIQGGKCRACKEKISIQYPLVEALNGILWGVVALIWGISWSTLIFCFATSVLIVISVIDIRTKEIPFSLNIALFALGIARVATDYKNWLTYLIGFFAVSVVLLLILLISKGKAMGGGDVKLMAAAGLLLGWEGIILAFIIGCVLGSVIHLTIMAVNKKKDHELAFGPYLSAGIYLTIIFGAYIINWYLGFFKI